PPAHSTRTVPKRSAIAPAKGWPAPQMMFWMAIARPNTSRSQPLACDIGVRKKPSVARGPKLRREIRQPHRTITPGGRQPSVERREVVCDEIAMSANPSEPESGSLRMKLAKTESEIPAACKRGGCERSVDRGADSSQPKRRFSMWGAFTLLRAAPQPKL